MNLCSLSTNLIIKKIKAGIGAIEPAYYFEPLFDELIGRANLLVMSLENKEFYRIRKINNDLFYRIEDLKYPPVEKCSQGRLNGTGEQVAYLSLDELAPLTELDLDYYQMYCLITVKNNFQNLKYHSLGIKGEYQITNKEHLKIIELFRDILNTKDKKYYNATNALAHLVLNKEIVDNAGNSVGTGLIYTAVNEDMTNRNLFNIAVNSEVFDEYFEITNVCCNILGYDRTENLIFIDTINNGIINSDGSINWELDYEQMIKNFNLKYSNHKLLKTENSIIDFRFGSGKIVEESATHYSVNFREGLMEVHKGEINDA